MRIIILSALTSLAFGLVFNTHSSCTGHEAACTGTTGDPTTCVGQEYVISQAMAAEGIDVSAVTTWTATTAMALSRNAYRYGWDYGTQFAVHIDLEPVYRCTIEQSGLTWAASTACFEEIGSCVGDPTCLYTMDVVLNTSKAVGVPTTYIARGLQAFGAAGVPFTPLADATTSPMTPMTAEQIGSYVAVADMSDNGKIMSMTSCMMKDWVGYDIQALYIPCFDIAVKCSEDANCAADSLKVANCADDKGVTMSPNAMLTNIYELPATASHDDWCEVAGCASEVGNSLFMSLGTCMMDSKNYSFTKCYDDMMAKLLMFTVLVGGGAWVGGVLMFLVGWCACCRSSNKQQVEA